MTLQHEITVSEDLKQWVGKEAARHTSPVIEVADIRKWAIAVHWPETPPRLFWDEPYAEKTRFGGIVAPENFNPFAWNIGIPAGAFLPDALGTISSHIRQGLNWVNGGTIDEFH